MPRVIAHPAMQTEAISSNQLTRIFTMKLKKWSDGTPVKTFVLTSQSSVHHDFVIGYFGMRTHQLDRLWNRLLYSGTGRGPTKVSSEQEMIELVNMTPGAIGYISDSLITEQTNIIMIEDAHE